MGKESRRGDDAETTVIDARHHILYAGVSLSGKTTLARFHARTLAKADHHVIAYDPVRTETAGGDWGDRCEIIEDYDDLMKRLEYLEGEPERPIFLFVDEAPDVFGHDRPENHRLPRVIRHRWIFLRIISQRPKMLPPDVRSQCWHTYMFRLTKDDARMVCADAGHGPEVYNLPLDKGDFVLMQSGSSGIERFNAFDLVE